MKHQTLNKPRIQVVREKYAHNRAFIQKVAKLNEIEYNTLLLETGWMFLEDKFPAGEMYNKYFRAYADQRPFWLWFRHEWKQWENDLTNFITENEVRVDEKFWKEEMQQMALDRSIEISFYNNYLKLQTHVI